MKKIFITVWLLILVTAMSHAQPTQEKLVALEKQAWEAFKNQQAKNLVGMLTKDYLGIRQNGTVLDRSGVIQAMYEYDISEVNLSDFRLSVVDPHSAFLTYTFTGKASRKGQPVPEIHMQATSFYVHSGGTWLVRFHQETPIAAPAPQTQTAPTKPK